MGVTNRNKITYKPSVASSTAGSSLESLHLPPETNNYESEETEHRAPFGRILVSRLDSEQSTRRAGAPGRRRAHRLKSLRDLENLGTIAEEDEAEDTIATYAANRTSPFLLLLNDSRLSKLWENFCSHSEVEQANIIQSNHNIHHGNHQISDAQTKRQRWNSKDENGYNIRPPVDAYKSLSYLTRRKLRKVKNLQPLSAMEEIILEHFYKNRHNLLENMDLENNMQFVCCAACQYYNLNLTRIVEKEGSQLVNIDGLARYTHCAQPLSAFLRSRRSSPQNS